MIKLIIWIVVGLLILSFFGISLQNLVEAPATQNNFDFLLEALSQGFDAIVNWLEGVWEALKNALPYV